MTYERNGIRSLDYKPCRYNGSKLLFRGPKRKLKGDFVVFLGGTETYGKFIEHPFPARVEKLTGLKCVNFGWPNSGVDVFLNEPAILEACAKAKAVVLQVPCALNMTNRYYSVHPRRNDRFVEPSQLMKLIFQNVDFTEFHFTRHLLRHLKDVSPERFGLIRDELQQAWTARMRLLLTHLGHKTILFWFSARPLSDDNSCPDIAVDPAFVTRQMLSEIEGKAASLVTVSASATALKLGEKGKIYTEMEAAAAAEVLGPLAHEEAANALSPAIQALLEQQKARN